MLEAESRAREAQAFWSEGLRPPTWSGGWDSGFLTGSQEMPTWLGHSPHSNSKGTGAFL